MPPRFRTKTRNHDHQEQYDRWQGELEWAEVETFSPAEEIAERIDRYLHTNSAPKITYSELMEWVFHSNEDVLIELMKHLPGIVSRCESIGVYGEINPHEFAEKIRRRIEAEAEEENCLWTPLLDQWGQQGVGRLEVADGPHRDNWQEVPTGQEAELITDRIAQIAEWLTNGPTESSLDTFREFEYWKLTELQLQYLTDLKYTDIRKLIDRGAQKLNPQARKRGSPDQGVMNRKLWSEEADQGPFWQAAMQNGHLPRPLLQQLLENGWEEMAPKPPWQNLAVCALDNETLKPEDGLELLDQYGQLPSRKGTERRLGGPLARLLLSTRMGQQDAAVRARIYTLAPRGVFSRTFQDGGVEIGKVLEAMGRENPDELLRKLGELRQQQLAKLQGKSIAGILQIEDKQKKQEAFRLLGHVQNNEDGSRHRSR